MGAPRVGTRVARSDQRCFASLSIMRIPDPTIRIAFTGSGIICSIGRNKEEVWQSIRESRAGIGKLSRFPGETFPTDMAAEVELDVGALLPIRKRDARRMSRSDRLALIAAAEAV